ncbi:MAG: mannose-6-phosphate isomerase, class I [Gemmatimonadetes bacterium]|nr:MAG: mannose-6-phosphate isomerase, class I [Gemmatimonadota bacterium]
MIPEPKPYRLQPQIQSYAWGTRDAGAYIPKLLGISPQPGRPYAELWIGAHPKAPSTVQFDDGAECPLHQWIAAHPTAILGEAVVRTFGAQLPFLLKVLSAGQALSIQTHPNKAQAELLHAHDPEHYPDANHKPEIAIALDSLSALVGFRSRHEIEAVLSQYPEIATFMKWQPNRELDDAAFVRQVFCRLIRYTIHHEDELLPYIEQLADRLANQPVHTAHESLFLELRQIYSQADIGLFVLFFLNRVELTAGEAMYTAAGVPHSYLQGNIVECMANSDNVVRLGLTSKFKDAATLINILDYTANAGRPVIPATDDVSQVYAVPSNAFQVMRWALPAGSLQVVPNPGAVQLLLVTSGAVCLKGCFGDHTLSRGECVLIPACLTEYTLLAGTDCQVFGATVPL